MTNEIKKLLTPYKTNGLKRYGGNHDGGYIFRQDLIDKCEHVYSYGVGPSEPFITFDREMVNMNKKVYMYDASVLPWWQEGTFFFKKEFVNRSNILEHIKNNGHENQFNMTLKMDIEGYEYDTLTNCEASVFSHFSQISIEVHDVLNISKESRFLNEETTDNLARSWKSKLPFFERLNSFYKLVHIHANNYSLWNNDGLYDILELTYIRNDHMPECPQLSKDACPISGLDFPNSQSNAEITLNWWL